VTDAKTVVVVVVVGVGVVGPVIVAVHMNVNPTVGVIGRLEKLPGIPILGQAPRWPRSRPR